MFDHNDNKNNLQYGAALFSCKNAEKKLKDLEKKFEILRNENLILKKRKCDNLSSTLSPALSPITSSHPHTHTHSQPLIKKLHPINFQFFL